MTTWPTIICVRRWLRTLHQNKRPSERMVFNFVMDRGAEAYTLKGRIFLPCNMRGAYSGLRI